MKVQVTIEWDLIWLIYYVEFAKAYGHPNFYCGTWFAMAVLVAFLSYSKYLCSPSLFSTLYLHILGLDHNENDERVVGSITKYTLGSVLPPFSAYCHYSSIDVSSITLIGNKWKQKTLLRSIICVYQKYLST